MPAFTGQFGIPGKRPGGATAWGGGRNKPAPGSNPLPSTSAAPAGQVYGGDSQPKAGGFGGGEASKPTWGGGYSAPPPQSGHWDMGQQGAEGAWSNGYNPHWERDQQASTGASAATVYQQGQAPSAGTPGGYGDARDNPNNTMGVFYDPNAKQGDVTGYYNDFVDPALRANQNGQQVSLEQAGIKAGSVADPTWDPQAIYRDPSSPFYIPPGDPRWNQ